MFVDSFYYGAHSTAMDALRGVSMGVVFNVGDRVVSGTVVVRVW